ncbi:MAG: cation transporter [Planctomycetaceae bacterium]|nr:cation transporter [Planctomycetaceae bacterium]MBC85053.1 cation transporter [Acidimicrobiaceae bacterium]|tara:strand:- start:1559 stop:2479 length:921 start_codon:yes stop_codon:yes gene_type:complete
MAATGGTKTIVTALVANFTIAVAKFFGFIITSSSAMLAEAVHSVADTSNQALLLLGKKRSEKLPSEMRQFGFGRERFFWAFVVSLVLFSLGSMYAIYEGIEKIRHPHEIDSLWWALAILLFAMFMEGYAFRTAVTESRHYKGNHSWKSFIRRSRIPELPVVLLEDFGALMGLVFAFICVLIADTTGNAVWDGIGTLSIGILLGLIAVVLAIETKSLLIGEGALPEQTKKIEDAITGSDHVVRLIEMRTEYLGPETLLIAAKIEFKDNFSSSGISDAVDAVEERIRSVEPLAKIIYLEPDTYDEVNA